MGTHTHAHTHAHRIWENIKRRSLDGQVVITIDSSYRAAVPTSLWVWALEHCGEKVCAVGPVALTCSVSGGVQASELLPEGP